MGREERKPSLKCRRAARPAGVSNQAGSQGPQGQGAAWGKARSGPDFLSAIEILGLTLHGETEAGRTDTGLVLRS